MSKDYCPKCHKVTEHIKEQGEMLCKRCGKIEKRMNFSKFLMGGK